MARILLIEDEERMADTLTRVLGEEGHVVEAAADGKTGLSRALDDSFDLLVVDWMLPGRSGLQVVRALRAAEIGTPVLMLTARSQVEDRVEGLDAGANDYLPKPFALPELLARVRALTRRPAGGPDDSRGITVGDVTLDPVRHVVRRGDDRVELTAREFALLAALMQRPEQVFSRSVLLDSVWNFPGEASTGVIDLYISYLRKKLDRDGEPSHIRTVRGVGYTFEPRP